MAFRDVDYLGTATVVELDGRLGHEWQREARLLAARGWRGELRGCGPTCTAVTLSPVA